MDREIWTERYGQRDMDREIWTERYGQRDMDREIWTASHRYWLDGCCKAEIASKCPAHDCGTAPSAEGYSTYDCLIAVWQLGRVASPTKYL
jgi:hypothetical protein